MDPITIESRISQGDQDLLAGDKSRLRRRIS